MSPRGPQPVPHLITLSHSSSSPDKLREGPETRPQSVIHSLSRDSLAFAQAETGDKTLTADRRTDGWMNGRMNGRLGAYLNEIPQQDGGDRGALLKKSTHTHFPHLLKQVTEALDKTF